MNPRPPPARVALAFAAVYLIWGSTYLAIWHTVSTLPVFLSAGVRFIISGALLYVWERAVRGTSPPERAQWKSAAAVGALLLLGGNGFLSLGERHVPSSLAALIVATVPLWMAVLEALRPGGSRPSPTVLFGILVGFAGVAILVRPEGRAAGEPAGLQGPVLVLFSSVAWAAGSVYARGAALPRSASLSTAMQMLAGGAMLFGVSVASGEIFRFDPARVSAASVLGLLYLIGMGSFVGFTAYIWLLRNVSPARVSTYAYVNPVVAIGLGFLLNGEPIGPRVLAAAAVIVAAVALIVSASRRKEGR